LVIGDFSYANFFYSQVMDTTVVTGSMQPVVCG
jgi:hypothetical protein